jgi:hypothetical protein
MAFDLLRGAGGLAPELAKLEAERERLRYERQKDVIHSLGKAGRLRRGLNRAGYLLAREVYRMVVRERGWSREKY